MSIIDSRPFDLKNIQEKLARVKHPAHAIPLMAQRDKLTEEIEAEIRYLQELTKPWTYYPSQEGLATLDR